VKIAKIIILMRKWRNCDNEL